jgi:hypothetical protein
METALHGENRTVNLDLISGGENQQDSRILRIESETFCLREFVKISKPHGIKIPLPPERDEEEAEGEGSTKSPWEGDSGIQVQLPVLLDQWGARAIHRIQCSLMPHG